MLVIESALNTAKTSPSGAGEIIYVRLSDGFFTMVVEPVFEEIMYGGGLAIPAEEISDHYICKGTLKTKLYPAQAPFLLKWATSRINTGQTSPWTTTEPPGDLASVSVYHAIQYSNGTVRRKRYSGTKVSSMRLEVSRGSTSAMLTLDLQACKAYGNAIDSSSDPNGTEFPLPAETDYPLNPYTFKNTGGNLKIASTTSAYESISIACQNALDGRHFETASLTINQFCGLPNFFWL